MKLHYAPNTRAVRTAWLLNEMGLEFEMERYQLGDASMRDPAFMAKNPNARVPVLEDGDTVINESTAIAQYLVAKYGDGSLARGPESPDFAAYLQWLHYAEGMIMHPMTVIVIETILLPPDRRNEANLARAQKTMKRMLAAVETQLDGKEYLIGDFTCVDTITGHACIMANRLGADVSEMPNLAGYIDRLKARPAFQAAWDA